jgi:NAD(P)-dependent dehydrogenase (short-subunit alcohol dehydrogenase family)
MTDVQDATYPSLRDRVVFITGGATGIGAAMVEHFARQRARVAFLDIADSAGHALVARLKQQGLQEPVFHHADLRDIAALRSVIAEVGARMGAITALVNNAAHDERHTIADVTPDYWEDRMAVNLRHQFFAAQAVIPMMRQAGGGSIVNMGSVSWHVGQGGMPAYTTAKAAIEGLTRGLARDVGPDRIRVNCIIPGWVMTERQVALWLTPEAEADLMKNQCLPDKVMPQDIARMALWLAADDSRMATSQTWTVDGGWS